MKREEAERLLGCYLGGNPPATVEDIARAFRQRLIETHADTNDGQQGTLPAQLQTARRLLVQIVAGRNTACAQCSGKGRVPAKMGSRTCSACKGSGETQT